MFALISILKFLMIIILILLMVATLTFERQFILVVLDCIKMVSLSLLQPLADGLKLLIREFVTSYNIKSIVTSSSMENYSSPFAFYFLVALPAYFSLVLSEAFFLGMLCISFYLMENEESIKCLSFFTFLSSSRAINIKNIILNMFKVLTYLLTIILFSPCVLLLSFSYLIGLMGLNTCLIYYLIYSNLDIKKSFWSFVRFSSNCIFLFLFLYPFYNCIFFFKNPIYITDLYWLSIFRYLFFIIITLIILLVLIFVKIRPNVLLKDKVSIVFFPYLLEETCILLRTKERDFFGPKFDFVLDKIFEENNKSYKFLFLLCYSFFRILVPIMQIIAFMHFGFLHGDLRISLFLLPLSLLSWLFRHIWYYFCSFVEENSNAVREYLIVENHDASLNDNVHENTFVFIDLSKLSFKLNPSKITEIPFEEQEVFLNELAKSFVTLGKANVFLFDCHNITKKILLILFGLRFFTWCQLCLFAFYSIDLISFLPQPFPLLAQRPAFVSAGLLRRFYATEAHRIHKAYQKLLEKKVPGIKADHPIATDDQKVDSNGFISPRDSW